MIQEALHTVCNGGDLPPRLAAGTAAWIMEGKATAPQISALLVGLKMKEETAEELYAFVTALRERSVRVTCTDPHAVDLCGTGGDGRYTFNISTMAAFVVAGAGITVAKHGNRAISGRCGSADLIEALGVKPSPSPHVAAAALREVGITFLYAPHFHPAMQHVQSVRRDIGVRTLFNLLGPLLNPAGVDRQLIGVFNPQAMYKAAAVLRKLRPQRCLLVHSDDGLDEISPSAPTRALLVEGDDAHEIALTPEGCGRKRRSANLQAHSVVENVGVLHAVLNNEDSIFRDTVLLNAGAAIYVSGRAADPARGVAMAEAALASGAARRKLEEFIRFHREVQR